MHLEAWNYAKVITAVIKSININVYTSRTQDVQTELLVYQSKSARIANRIWQ